MAQVATRRPAIRWKRDGGIIIDTQDQGLRDLLIACMYDENRVQIFLSNFFPGVFDGEWNYQRCDFLRKVTDYSLPRVGVLARRTFGKTTLMIGATIHSLLFRQKKFCLFSSNRAEIAEERTESLRSMIMTSPEIRDIWGYMRPQSVDGMKETFGAKSWRLVDPITGEPFAAVVPRSSNSTVNGMVLYVAGSMQRPDILISDDGEDRFTVNNEELRVAFRHWMNDVFFQCVDTNYQPDPQTQRWKLATPMSYAPWNIRVIDTNKHDDAFLPRLMEAPRTTSEGEGKFWEIGVYPIARATDGATLSFKSLIPEISDKQVNALYKGFEADGNPGGFWREFMCVRKPGFGNVFPASFQYYKEGDLDLNDEGIDKFIICDPALTEDPKAAYSSMLAVAVDRINARIYLRRQITERMSPEEFDDALFRMAQETNTHWILIEGLKGNNRFRDAMVRAAFARGQSCAFESLSTRTGTVMLDGDFGTGRLAAKRRRAVFAVRLYRPFEPTHPNGHVWHEESMMDSPTEAQMRSYPNCTWWDALDCVGHIPQAMALLGIFFDHQIEGDGLLGDADPDFGRDTTVSMFGEVMNQGSWRVC